MFTRFNRVVGTKSFTLCYSTKVQPDVWTSLALMLKCLLASHQKQGKLVACGRYGKIRQYPDGSYAFVS